MHRPRPPYSSGRAQPNRPSSAAFSRTCAGISSRSSISVSRGTTSLRTNSRTASSTCPKSSASTLAPFLEVLRRHATLPARGSVPAASTEIGAPPLSTFYAHADQAPDRLAVLAPDGRRATFGELAARANQLTHALGGLGL